MKKPPIKIETQKIKDDVTVVDYNLGIDYVKDMIKCLIYILGNISQSESDISKKIGYDVLSSEIYTVFKHSIESKIPDISNKS